MERFIFDENLKTADELNGALGVEIANIQKRFRMEQEYLTRSNTADSPATCDLPNTSMRKPAVSNNSMCGDPNKYMARTNSDYRIEEIEEALKEELAVEE